MYMYPIELIHSIAGSLAPNSCRTTTLGTQLPLKPIPTLELC
jgi:hypothetical protein